MNEDKNRFVSVAVDIEGMQEGGRCTIVMELHGRDYLEFFDFLQKRGELGTVRYDDGVLTITRRGKA